jgi:hypothetical protein
MSLFGILNKLTFNIYFDFMLYGQVIKIQIEKVVHVIHQSNFKLTQYQQ